MAPWTAPAAAASILLIATGATKFVRPAASAVALPLALSPRISRLLARSLGVVELVVGLSVLVVGNRLTEASMAALYVGFAGFAYFALRSGASSCGCTGAPDTPATPSHVVMNVAFAVPAGLAAATSQRSSGGVLVRAADDPMGAAVLAMTVVVAWLAWLVLGLGALRSLGLTQKGRTT